MSLLYKLLIANRGEIACRVAATARRMGISTVAVYSDVEANAKHVAACDEAVCIGGAAPRDSYLRGDEVLRVAKRLGVDAIHPGYGFLSENEDFAQACTREGIVFVGPPVSAIQAMGLKSESKRLMEKAGVPLVPGYHGERQEPAFLLEEAKRIGFPVLIKASAGGGGKGMKPAFSANEFLPALESAKREAKNAFGDEAVLIEKYLQAPRHIEIQVFADTLGNCVYLFERDCSVQRRHQKVLEETPAPGLTDGQRKAMGEAAVAAAKAVGYVGAGTVEFIAENGEFFFMEMNTRLQVEHPVTEMITGLDLVEWQLRVARGERLPRLQHELAIHGHALEARVYAEDPDREFLPATGTLDVLRWPRHVSFTASEPLLPRVDSGVREGDTITPYYDPLIAKLIVWGETRDQALARMAKALRETAIIGPANNVAFLSRAVTHPAFARGGVDTGFIAAHRAALLPTDALVSEGLLIGAALAVQQTWSEARAHDDSPFAASDGFWVGNPAHLTRVDVATVDEAARVQTVFLKGIRAVVSGVGAEAALAPEGPWCCVRLSMGESATLDINDARYAFNAVHHADHVSVRVGDVRALFRVIDRRAPPRLDRDEGGHLNAPMPGSVIAIHVKAGDTVAKGQALLVLEAMKMEHTIKAPRAGLVESVFVTVGQQVKEGAELVSITSNT